MRKSEIINDKEDKCCGCSACYNVCPVNAIQMSKDCEGFLEPIIIDDKCINCKLCNKVCPANQTIFQGSAISSFAMQSKDRELILNSSSGGFFSVFAKHFIEKNFKSIVVGATSVNDGSVKHIIIENVVDLHKLQKSKYAQSDMNNTMTIIRKKLENDYSVLFVGTPCQIAGLKNYLRTSYDKLTSIDFICHGVPSSRLWVDYIKNLGKIKSVDFRNKETGWKNFSLMVAGDKGEINRLHYKDPYMKAFLNNFSLRESCYQCKYKNNRSGSDITIGDFWGIEELNFSKFINDLGVSFVQSNTIKGDFLLDQIKEEFFCEIVENDINRELNRPQFESVARPKERDDFYKKVYRRNKFSMRRLKSFTNDSLNSKVKRNAKKIALIIGRRK